MSKSINMINHINRLKEKNHLGHLIEGGKHFFFSNHLFMILVRKNLTLHKLEIDTNLLT